MKVVYTVPQSWDSEHVRAEKRKVTSAVQRALNFRTAQRRLEMLLAANFRPEDLFYTLTYRDEDLLGSHAVAKARVRESLKLFRNQRKRKNAVLKYVYITEGKHGDKRYIIILSSTHLVTLTSKPFAAFGAMAMW